MCRVWLIVGVALYLSVFHGKIWASGLELSEVLADPVGDEEVGEWIEVFNPANSVVSTQGYSLEDGYGSVVTYMLPAAEVSPSGFLVVSRIKSKITLNNDVERVYLHRPDGSTDDSGVFSPIEGKSWAKVAGTWQTTVPSPGEQNIATALSSTPSPSPFPSPLPSPTPPIASPSPSPSVWIFDPSPSPSPLPEVPPVSLELTEVSACSTPTEWVELYNPTDTAQSLYGWKFKGDDDTEKVLNNQEISGHAYLALQWKSGFLRNTGEVLRLFWHDTEQDRVRTLSCTAGESLAKVDGEWLTTTHVTPGQENIVMASAIRSTPEVSVFSPLATGLPVAGSPEETSRPSSARRANSVQFFPDHVLSASASGLVATPKTMSSATPSLPSSSGQRKEYSVLVWSFGCAWLGVGLQGPLWYAHRLTLLRRSQRILGKFYPGLASFSTFQ